MAKADLEARVVVLETEIARLRSVIEKPEGPGEPGWNKLVGKYANDPAYDEAMRLGREYRESSRPKPRRRKKV